LLGGGEDCCAYSKELESSGGCVRDQPIAGIRGMKRIKTALLISSNAFLPTRIEDNQHPVGCMPTKNSFPSSFLKSNCAARKLAEEATNRCGYRSRKTSGKLVMECILETKAATILQFIHGLRGSL